MERQNERMVGYFTSCTECYCPSVHNSKPRLRFWPEKPQCALSPAPAPVPSPSPNPTRSPAQSPSPNPTPSPWPDGDGVCCAPYQSWGQSYYYVPTWPLCRKPTVSPRTPMSSFSAEMDRMGSPRTILTVAAHPTSPFCPPPPPAPPAPPYLCQTGNNFFDNTIGPPVISGGRPANYRCCGAIHVGNCASPPYPWEQLWGGWGPSTGGEGSYGNCNSEHAPKPVPCKSYRGELYNCFNCRIRRDLLPADFDDIRFSSLPVTARRYDSSDRKGAWGQNL